MTIVGITILVQILLVEFCGDFAKTTRMGISLWGWSFVFGFLSWPWGMVLRWLWPLQEDPHNFFHNEDDVLMPGVEPCKDDVGGITLHYQSPRPSLFTRFILFFRSLLLRGKEFKPERDAESNEHLITLYGTCDQQLQ